MRHRFGSFQIRVSCLSAQEVESVHLKRRCIIYSFEAKGVNNSLNNVNQEQINL